MKKIEKETDIFNSSQKFQEQLKLYFETYD